MRDRQGSSAALLTSDAVVAQTAIVISLDVLGMRRSAILRTSMHGNRLFTFHAPPVTLIYCDCFLNPKYLPHSVSVHLEPIALRHTHLAVTGEQSYPMRTATINVDPECAGGAT
jgi:glucose-6-phosphate-specific signal transduction histidine kinase